MVDWFDYAGGKGGTPLPVEMVVDAGVIGRLLEIVDLGCLVSLGKTRDGGAVSITVTNDGRHKREWFRDCMSAAAWLEQGYAAIARAKGLPPEPPQKRHES